jgi:hypothetical protein
MDKWQNKVRQLRHFLKGWARNLSRVYKKEKERLTQNIDKLDIKAETCPLIVAKRDTEKDAHFRLATLRRDEESKWAQRAKVKHIRKGGSDTKYFYLIANEKHRNKKIF